MKTIKKIFSLFILLAASLMQLNVNAASNGTITINKAIVNETYSIYKVLDLETYDKANNHYIYRAATGWESFLNDSTKGGKYLDAKSENGAVYYVWKSTVSDTKAKDFAEEALVYANAKGIDATATKKATSTTVKFENLSLGYYLTSSSVGALLHLSTTNPNATVYEKNTTTPDVEKTVLENSTGTYGKENDASINTTVSFKGTVITGAGYGSYVLYDKMDAGLTLNPSSINVKIGDTLVDTANYTINTNVTGYTFTVSFKDDFIAIQPIGTKIDVYYTAKLNENAVIEGDGNVNENQLKYGDKQETEKRKTVTYTYAFDLKKTNSSGEELQGAEFKLLDNSGKEIKVVLKDAKTNTYRLAVDNETGVSIKAGSATIEGLDKDTYKLEETVAPVGYNKLTSPEVIKITGKVSGTTYERVAKTVVNYTGSKLPETGGMGTMLFITTGLVTITACGLLLVTKLRAYKENI